VGLHQGHVLLECGQTLVDRAELHVDDPGQVVGLVRVSPVDAVDLVGEVQLDAVDPLGEA